MEIEKVATPIKFGVFFSIVVFGLFFAMLFFGVESVCGQKSSKWSYLLRATPNEIGDTLAGFAGTLAFIWIIVTVFLQWDQLKAQKDELAATRAELVEARKEYKAMVVAQEE